MRGSVARKGKRWYPVVYQGIDSHGKKKYKWYQGFDTKREATRFLTEKLSQINNGIPDPTNELLEAYLTQWLIDKKAQVRPGTYRSYQWLVNRHIIPEIGYLPLSKLKPSHIQTLYTKMQGASSSLSNQSVLNAHRVLVQALNRAVKWDLIHKNAAVAVDPPRPAKIEMQVWSDDILLRFLSATKRSKFHIAYVLLSATGMRLGELLALQWCNVDLDKSVIRVVRSYSYTGHGYQMQEPKTASGRRAISIPRSVTEELLTHKELQNEERKRAAELWQDDDLVICTGLGKPILQHNIRMSFQRTVKQLGLPSIRLQDLRHTHATMLLKRGVHPKIVQERLGHSDIGLTLNTYSHVLPTLQEEAAEKIDELYSALK